jgi:hypothetical protein
MIAASGNQGRVHAAPMWAEFGRGAARTVGKPASRVIERTDFRAGSRACTCVEDLP